METNKKLTVVGDEYRTNPLSLIPGGSEVEVHYQDYVKVYTNIKNPAAYIRKITTESNDPIIAIYVDGNK
jgi:intein-encoded DNA endonuclease-like protein